MKISPKTIAILFVINIGLAMVCAYMMRLYHFSDDLEALWEIPLAITIGSLIILVFSRIAEVAINKPVKKYKVYFAGQLLITVLIFSVYAWYEIASANYKSNQANIDHNKRFVDNFYGETNTWKDSMRIRALHQLEATCKNRNDLRLEYYNSEKRDTVLANVSDSVLFIDFTYSLKNSPGISFCSKHIMGDKIEQLIYYHIPVSATSPTHPATH